MNLPSPLDEAISRDLLVAETRSWAQRIGVQDLLREIHVRSMKRKWASISTNGRLTLNSDLLRQPASFRHEVIVHELVHLKTRSGKHDKLFRTLVRAYLADLLSSSQEEKPHKTHQL
ncbi:MAG: M48 family metallopeptidase [Pseudothermotoga sp.]